MSASGPPSSGPDPLPDRGIVCIGTYRGGVIPLYCADGTWSVGEPYNAAKNASFGVYSARYDLHYLVDEQDDGAIGAYRSTRTDGWQQIARVAVDGAAPCHITLSPSESRLAVANYASGSVSLFTLNDAGIPITPATTYANRGSGPNAERQRSPHAHWVGFSADEQWLYQTDLGTDEILAFAVDLAEPRTAFRASPGSGPRHVVFHPYLPEVAYLACELANTVTVLASNELASEGATLRARHVVSTLPSGHDGLNILAHIAINRAGDRLYVSNRGHDSIAVFALNETGDAVLMQHAGVGGAYPRHFLLLEDERRAIVANEKDESVTILTIDAQGLLASTGVSLAVPGAAFAFVPRSGHR